MGYKYIYDINVFLKEDDISYYLLGLFITDGNVYIKKPHTIQCEIKSIDYDLLDSIRGLICPSLPLSQSHNNCYRLRIHNKDIGNWLISKGCIPNKTKVVKFPNIPEEYQSHFIRGLIDGDGSIGIYGNIGIYSGSLRCMVRFDSASHDLISGLCFELNNRGIKCRISKTKWITSVLDGKEIKSTTQMYRLAFTGLMAYKLLKFVYSGDRISLSRKKVIANSIFSYIERNGLSEQELLSIDKLSIKKWPTDIELFDLMVRHKGSLTFAAHELKVSGWGLSSRLRKIGIYDRVRNIFPYDPIKNITKEKM